MKELNHQHTESLQLGSPVPGMSLFEKARLWAGPIIAALISVPIFIVSALVLLFNVPNHLHPLDRLLPVVLLVLCGIGIYGSAGGFLTIVRRNLRTGSFLPTGDDLAQWRKARQKLAPWEKVVIPGVFCVIAIGSTQSALAAPHHHPTIWIIPVLMWIAAILITFAFTLQSAPNWIDSAVAVVWCSAGLWYIISVLASHSRGAEYWAFPIVMFLMAAVLQTGNIRRRKQSPAEPLPNQAPPI